MIRHVSGVAEIVEDVEGAVRFYRDVLGLDVQYEPGSGYATIEIAGTLHFGIWSRRAAAENVFGDANVAERIPLGFTLGFEVDSVAAAQQMIEAKGWHVAQALHTESWGQTTCRFFGPSGALCEVAETPWARRIVQPMQVETQGD